MSKDNTNKHINSYTPQERRQVMISRLQKLVQVKNGWFDPDEYQNRRTPVTFKCDKGHEWSVQPQSVLSGSWCRTCWEKNEAGRHLKVDGLAQAREIANLREGECLSAEYKTSNAPMLWCCVNKHEWQAALSDIKKGGWCPQCGGGVRERLCRYYIEELTKLKFPKARPAWLINAKGNLMELDGYCEQISLAFEHQGQQHYKAVEHFNRRQETLQRRIEDDQKKKDLCVAHEVELLEIPFYVGDEELLEWIRNKVENVRPRISLTKNVDIKKYVPSNELSELKEIAISKGGKCLSAVYKGVRGTHEFSCQLGHEWFTSASLIKQGTWCPICKLKVLADKQRSHSVESMQQIAAQKNGKFLSKTFNSVNDRYRWKCLKNHEWIAAPSDVIRGSWCKKCSLDSLKIPLDVAIAVARKHDGECLSTSIDNSFGKLTWRCSEGHEWESRLNNVMHKNSWCPRCAKDKLSDAAWNTKLANLIEYLKLHDFKSIGSDTTFNGIAIGQWVELQRRSWKKNQLKHSRQSQLEKIGWVRDCAEEMTCSPPAVPK